MALLAFHESYFATPKRAAQNQREQAEREGWARAPKVLVDYGIGFGICVLRNDDARPIHRVSIARYAFPVNLSQACDPDAMFHYGDRGRVQELAPGASLHEDTTIGPPIKELGELAQAPRCPPGDDCVVVVECLGRFDRDADRKGFRWSGWGLFDPHQGKEMIPLQFLPADERGQRAVQCASQGAKKRDQLLAHLDKMLHGEPQPE